MANCVTAFVTDLIFSTKITSTADTLGVAVYVVRTLEGLSAHLADAADPLVLIDLNAAGADPLEAIRIAQRAPHRPRTVAYVSHVQADLAEAARRAGVDEVMPRSAFAANLPALLASAK